MPQRRARADAAPAEEPVQEAQHWRRIVLAPGVELHIREPVTTALHDQIERLLALARSLFKADE
jgi:hypothetical protein